MLLGVGSIVVSAAEEDTNSATSETTEDPQEVDEDTDKTVSEDNPEIKVFTTLSGSKLKVSISNTSEEDMKNSALLFNKDNRYSTSNNYKDLGIIKPGETKEIVVPIVDIGHGVLKNFCDATGGAIYGLFFIGVLILLILLYVARLIYRKKKGKKGKGSTILFTLAGITILVACGVVIKTSPQYTVLDEGQNYAREIKETYKDEDLLCTLKYNQDIIEEKVTSKEEEVNFDIDYTYDENKPVTEDTEIVSEGKKGKRLVTTTVIYRNGKVDDTVEDSYMVE